MGERFRIQGVNSAGHSLPLFSQSLELGALDEFRNLFLANDPETLAMVAEVKMLVAQQSARENYGATVDA